MALTSKLARPLLAGIFVYGGVAALRQPKPHAQVADDVARPTAEFLGMDWDTESMVKGNGIAQVAGGLLLATGKFRRLAALTLAGTLVPTTLAAHRFWEEKEPDRSSQLQHFLKNLGLLGGLILAETDTEGRPGVAWRSRHALEHASTAASHQVELAGARAAIAAEHAKAQVGKAGLKAAKATKRPPTRAARKAAKHQVKRAKKVAKR